MNEAKTIPARPPMTAEQRETRPRRIAAWEKDDCPVFRQDAPLNVKDIYNAFVEDYASAEKTTSKSGWTSPASSPELARIFTESRPLS